MNFRPRAQIARRVLPVVAAAAVGAGVGAAVYATTSSGPATTAAPSVVVPAQPTSSQTSGNTLTQLYKQDAPGVVDITVTSTTSSSGGSGSQNPFAPGFGQPPNQKTEAEGTGFVIDSKGDIVTAEHVVDGANSITVHFQNGTSAKATLVGSDKSTDTAVINVNVPSSQLHPLALGNSSSVQPGDAVVAIGSPFGLTESMTAGIVSAVNRTITAPNRFSIPGAIQTDAAINHGNSGGPLIDVATNTVIGVNDQIESDTQDNAGVGFAVPIDAAKSVADTLIAGGTVRHAWLGVGISDAASGGVRITQVVSNSPAAKAGLQAGDVIEAVNGNSVANADALSAIVTGDKPGQQVTLTVRHGSTTKHVTVTLGTQPS
ncbi:MAG TPA: trypsin-like peptidase domain-containing protein [Gaiellaceae bacterium]|jgi:putative serine protease PepD|nr:trypsin-like peptidase domain-containing protein [Gaiellaceae bacterium]